MEVISELTVTDANMKQYLIAFLSSFELGIHVIVLTPSNVTHLAYNRDTPETEMSVSLHTLSLQQFLLQELLAVL